MLQVGVVVLKSADGAEIVEFAEGGRGNFGRILVVVTAVVILVWDGAAWAQPLSVLGRQVHCNLTKAVNDKSSRMLALIQP